MYNVFPDKETRLAYNQIRHFYFFCQIFVSKQMTNCKIELKWINQTEDTRLIG
ncbi:hypothetical protein BXY64_3173 [Marinifilum flexuosum]|uniref:Uncharacterized protein n=1 Tax=Marinifilum flexuosum TaxID=1117708 RepID=A0A419WXJ2_9BACT|nr:hypothetical protein BXY64_3173 [Marinifilum flexuosum]